MGDKMKTNQCKRCGIFYEGEVCPNCSIQCRFCDHAWNTKSKMKKVTCPSCLLKTPNLQLQNENTAL